LKQDKYTCEAVVAGGLALELESEDMGKRPAESGIVAASRLTLGYHNVEDFGFTTVRACQLKQTLL